MVDITAGHPQTDGELSDPDQTLDEEFGNLVNITPEVRRTRKKNRVPQSDPGPRRSNRERRPVDRFTYDSYVARHYAYMAHVTQESEPISFEEAVQKKC